MGVPRRDSDALQDAVEPWVFTTTARGGLKAARCAFHVALSLTCQGGCADTRRPSRLGFELGVSNARLTCVYRWTIGAGPSRGVSYYCTCGRWRFQPGHDRRRLQQRHARRYRLHRNVPLLHRWHWAHRDRPGLGGTERKSDADLYRPPWRVPDRGECERHRGCVCAVPRAPAPPWHWPLHQDVCRGFFRRRGLCSRILRVIVAGTPIRCDG